MTAFGELGEHGLWLWLVVALRFLPHYFVALGPRYNKTITRPARCDVRNFGALQIHTTPSCLYPIPNP